MHVYLLSIDICIIGHVRLIGGKDDREGRVEICSNGVWGTIYSRGWGSRDATVACRQLGFYQPYSSTYLVLIMLEVASHMIELATSLQSICCSIYTL